MFVLCVADFTVMGSEQEKKGKVLDAIVIDGEGNP